MTRQRLEQLVRRELDTLPPVLQEAAILRATGAKVVVFHLTPIATLRRIYGACRAVALLAGY